MLNDIEPLVSEDIVTDKKNTLNDSKQEVGTLLAACIATGIIFFIIQKPVLVFIDMSASIFFSCWYIYLCGKMFFTGKEDETEQEDLNKKISACFSTFLTLAVWSIISFPLQMGIMVKFVLLVMTGILLLTTLIFMWIKNVQSSKP